MKQFVNLALPILLTVATLSFTACGNDDEPSSSKGNGKVSVAYEGATTTNFDVAEATYSLYSQGVVGSTHIDYSEGATFHATLDEDGYMVNWQFQTRDEIEKGANLSISGIFFDSFYYYTDESTGEAKVTSVGNNKITIAFKNFQFDRKLDSGGSQEMTVNGNITFVLDD